MSKNTNYNILLICEGENTEPSYYQSIKDIVTRSKAIWTEGISIVIKPTPKVEDSEEAVVSIHKSKRKKRVLLAQTKPIDRKEVEDAFRQEPVRFVREAQLELEEGTFDEAWAIFDFDNRKYTKEAFELAENEIEGKTVKIAFSNISFEYWFLLHFEKINYSFEKSECREGSIVLDCNSGVFDNDCYGVKCVGGYLRKNKYIEVSTKTKGSLYPTLEDKLRITYHNSSWLRKEFIANNQGNKNSFWLAPYTDVDILVKRLFQDNNIITWVLLDEIEVVNGIEVLFLKNENNLNILITNTNNLTIIINSIDIKLENDNYETIDVGNRKLINPNSQESFEVEIISNDEFITKYISVQLDNIKLICEF